MLETLDEATKASYEQAGWTTCHHDPHTDLHLNVKVHGNYRKESDTFARLADLPQTDDEIRRVAQSLHERDLETWWEDLYDNNVDYLLSADHQGTGLSHKDYWQDGRMGGWFHVSNEWAANHPDMMPLLAAHCQGSVAYYSSDDWYDYLEEMVRATLAEFPDAGKERCHTCGKPR